jgi:2-polyprenyl-6-methoxyphenol hydroxylase-like FAD-dependent oxidoreductase
MHLKMKVVITGGGIAGLTTAIALQQVGISCTIYEASPELKPVGAGIVLAANAIKAFKKTGIAQAILEKGRLLDAFTILDTTGKTILKTNSSLVRAKFGTDNFTIHRADLHQVLLSFIPPENLQLNKRCVHLERTLDKVFLFFQDGSKAEADYVLACDGIHSGIRSKLLPGVYPRYAGYTCWRAVVDSPHLAYNEATETWGTHARFGMVPLPAGKIYWFACIPAAQNDQNLKNYTSLHLLNYFKNFHSPIPELLHLSQNEQLLWNDICDIKPLKRFAFDNILLLGDAAHATTPNMGQGSLSGDRRCGNISHGVAKNHPHKRCLPELRAETFSPYSLHYYAIPENWSDSPYTK